MNFDLIHSAVVCAVLTSLCSHHRAVKLATLFNREAMRPSNTTRLKQDSTFLEYFIFLMLFLLRYKWLCLSRIQLIYLGVSRPLVGPVASYIQRDCQFVMLALCQLSFCRCLTLIFYHTILVCFELIQLHSGAQ